MYRVLVRAKKDADAVRAALRVFYEGWGIEVATAGGVRGYEDFRDALSRAVDPARFNIVLLGREDAGKMQLEEMPLNVAFSLVPRERVRNARLTTIRDAIERGRAKIRNTVR
jgi:3'-phosphoadenosine 5'-phosphosulfate sulfotransferase